MGLPTEPMLMERTSPPRARVGLLLLGRLLLLLLPDRLLVLVLRKKLGRAMRVDLTSASSPPRGEASEELESPDAAGLSAVAAGAAAAAAVPAAVDPERRQSHPSARLKSADGLVGE